MSSPRLVTIFLVICGLIVALATILLQKQPNQFNNSNGNDSKISSSSKTRKCKKRCSSTDKNNNNINQNEQTLSPLLTHDLVFLGDSNTLGVLLVNPLAGWRLHGGYPRSIIERRHIFYTKRKMNKAIDNEKQKGHMNSNVEFGITNGEENNNNMGNQQQKTIGQKQY